jgi:hypothetical protein
MALTRDDIIELLRTNDRAVVRAIVVINSNQTADEQEQEANTHHNGIGFRSTHAKIGTSMAKFYLERGYLSPNQIAYWRRTDKRGNMNIGIYWKQLIAAAEAKQQQEVSFNYGFNTQ